MKAEIVSVLFFDVFKQHLLTELLLSISCKRLWKISYNIERFM